MAAVSESSAISRVGCNLAEKLIKRLLADWVVEAACSLGCGLYGLHDDWLEGCSGCLVSA